MMEHLMGSYSWGGIKLWGSLTTGVFTSYISLEKR